MGRLWSWRERFFLLAFALIGPALLLTEPLAGKRSTLAFKVDDPRIDLRPWAEGSPLLQEPVNPITPDVTGFVLPGVIRSRQIADSGELPLWDGTQLLGYPILANLPFPVSYPVTWFLQGWVPFLPPLDPITVLDVMLWLHIALACVLAYRFCRMMNIEPAFAAFAAVGFALSGWMYTRWHAPQILYTTVWWPGQLTALMWLKRDKKFRALLEGGLATGLMFLAGFPQVALVLTGAFVFVAVLDRQLWRWSGLPYIGAMVLLGAMLAAPQLKLSSTAYANSLRSDPETTAANAGRALPPASLVGMLFPEFFGRPSDFSMSTKPALTMESWLPQRLWWTRDKQNNVVENAVYPGLLILLLLIAALLGRKGVESKAWIFMLLALLALVAAMAGSWISRDIPLLRGLAVGNLKRLLCVVGASLPFAAAMVLQAVGISNMRVPWRAAALILAGIVIVPVTCANLDDLDADRFAGMMAHQAVRQAFLLVLAMIALVLVAWSAKWLRHRLSAEERAHHGFGFEPVRENLMSPGAGDLQRIALAVRWLPAVVLALDLVLLARVFNPFPEQTPAFPENQTIAELAARPGRTALYGDGINLLLPNGAGLHGIRCVQGVMPMVPARGAELLACIEGPLFDKDDPRVLEPFKSDKSLTHPLLDLLNVNTVVHSDPRLSARTGLPELFRRPEVMLGALKRPKAGPRAFLCGGARAVQNKAERLTLLADRKFPIHRTVLLEAEPSIALPQRGKFLPIVEAPLHNAEGEVQALAENSMTATDMRHRLKVNATYPGILVLTEAWDPGWRVRVDGEEAKVHIVDHALMGTELEAGLHDVEFFYRPGGMTFTLILSFAAVAVLLASGVMAYRRRDQGVEVKIVPAPGKKPDAVPDIRPPAMRRHAEDLGEFEGQAVSIIIPAYDDSANLRRVIWSIEQTADLPYELIIARAKQCVAKNRNAGLDRATQDLTVFMDDDVLLPAGWLSNLVSGLAKSEDIGAVSSLLIFPNGAPQTRRPDLKLGEFWDVTAPGTCFVYSRRRVSDTRFDENYLGSQWEDTDWIWQVKELGLKTLVTGDVTVVHDHQIRENQWLVENMTYFQKKWGRMPAPDDIFAITPEAFAAWKPPPLPGE
jgi:hypothetical protein